MPHCLSTLADCTHYVILHTLIYCPVLKGTKDNNRMAVFSVTPQYLSECALILTAVLGTMYYCAAGSSTSIVPRAHETFLEPSAGFGTGMNRELIR